MGSDYPLRTFSGSSHVFTPEGFVDALKRFGKATGTASASASSPHSHNQHLPPTASMLSKPENQISGIRSSSNQLSGKGHDAARARDPGYANGGGSGYAHPAPGGGAGGGGLAAPRPEPYTQSSYDRRFHTASAPAPSASASTSAGGRNSQISPAAIPPTVHNGGGRASPSPSAMSDTSAAQGKTKEKEKKKSRNPFKRF